MKRAHDGLLKSQNPVFMKWLDEIKLETKGIMAYNIGKAIMSLQKCPNKLKTVADCSNLKFFGKKICELLEKKAEEHENTDNQESSADSDDFDDEDEDVGRKRAKKNDDVARNETYVPVEIDFNAYIILCIMYKYKQKATYRGHTSKTAIVSEAQKFVNYQMNDEDFPFKPTISRLIDENYVIQKGPTLFSITDSGSKIIASSLIFKKPPNPLFVKWITKMEKEASEKKSKKHTTLKKLLNIFQKCPIRLISAKDCMNFDSIFNRNALNLEWAKEIFNELDSKLEHYKNGNNQPSDNDDEEMDTDYQKSDADCEKSDEEDGEEDLAKKTEKVSQIGSKTKTRGAEQSDMDSDGEKSESDEEDVEEDLAKKTKEVSIQNGRKPKARGVKK